jgi:hypothetical protein
VFDLLDIFFRKESEHESQKTGTGWSQWGLSIHKVVFVNYENHTCKLQGIQGSVGSEQRVSEVPVLITYPGGGTRSFLGVMPSIGDFCVVGWISAGSSGQASAKRPMILNWFPPAPGLAREWLSAQEYEHGEGMDTYGMRKHVEGAADRHRFKLRHMEPGHVVASSAQGSDMILDDSVRLTNRRGNEILLREQDQHLVTRSVVSHMATAGTRVYFGPIQRDTNLLPAEVFSDGINYETTDLANYLNGVLDWDEALGVRTPETLWPATPFRRTDEGMSLFESWTGTDLEDLDPFNFLSDGGFIGAGMGENMDVRKFEDHSYYGGKSFFRFAIENAVIGKTPTGLVEDAASDTELTQYPEFRVEVEQETDATLPVTEQTDGFDADRLPDGYGNSVPPLAEFVLGTVVGNDFYGSPDLYGKPIAPKIDGKTVVLDNGEKKPLSDHAAFLLKVQPTDLKQSSTWVSVRKDGKVIASLANGLELFVKNGYKFMTASPLNLGSSEETVLSAGGELSLKSLTKNVVIEGASPSNEGTAMDLESKAERDQSKDAPSVHIRAKKGSVKIEAETKLDIKTPEIRMEDGKALSVEMKDHINLNSGSKLTYTGGSVEEGSLKTCTRTHSGGNPLDGPCLKVSIPCNPATGAVAPQLVQDDYFLLMGSVMRKHLLGDKTEIMGTGMKTEVLGAGVHTSIVSANSVVHSAAGFIVTAATGAIVQTAASGAISQTASVAFNTTTAGVHVAVAAGGHIIQAPANASAPGFAVTSGSLCPISGRPLLLSTNCAMGTLIA